MGCLEGKVQEDYADYSRICELLKKPTKPYNEFYDDFEKLKDDSRIVWRDYSYQLK